MLYQTAVLRTFESLERSVSLHITYDIYDGISRTYIAYMLTASRDGNVI